MKKIWVYLLGVLTGIIVTILVLALIGAGTKKDEHSTKKTNGMTFFEEVGDVVEPSSVRVLQVLDDGMALAMCQTSTGTVVLLYNEEGTPYYDMQIVNAPGRKCFRQVGIFRVAVEKGSSMTKSFPIVMLWDN